ncbi:FMN adenylyltransferase /riboflavin kinase [Scopulibacillus darangshiensis]|uniref:Riboflavin biosynthesis protein n=1 Tax=Scopulibacillus darangshiensis TaxID=442528 RepID=A0A4R2P7N3_9BACL|nr:bifunctional riboflavin kinase/FAD synthetase [Scopulibacillus darangshiensis]TCP30288.1 FMN adenylyltransferase /riboflavin kinase [Scopulibacillus darangshiensis]
MEKIYLTHPPDINHDDTKEKVIALGYFDGVHIGHQRVIKAGVEMAREKGLQAAVMTFHPHPSMVLKQLRKRDNYLTPPDAKAEVIADLGVDLIYFVTFNETFSRLSPQEFVDEYLIKLHAKHVVAGFDYTYGRMAKGNMENIGEYSRKMFSYSVISRVDMDGEKISTTKIRELISDGAVDRAARYLGRPYEMKGVVVHGDKRGRTIGFPTANIQCDAPYVYPANGIYTVQMKANGRWYNGLCSIGIRPTFYDDNQPVTIEVYLLDFNGDLYGEEVTVSWGKKLRDEEKFDNVEDLVAQMENDKVKAICYFSQEDGL